MPLYGWTILTFFKCNSTLFFLILGSSVRLLFPGSQWNKIKSELFWLADSYDEVLDSQTLICLRRLIRLRTDTAKSGRCSCEGNDS